MRILIACEESQTVCNAFRLKGHIAFSSDVIECSGGHPEWHIQGDVLPLLNGDCAFNTVDGEKHTIEGEWDMIIAFPPCTYLTNAGSRHFSTKWNTEEQIAKRKLLRKDAFEFFVAIANSKCEKIVIENPVGYVNTYYKKPSQIVHPYYFGEPFKKRTCLWLKGVDKLTATNMLPKPEPIYFDKKTGKARNWVDSLSNNKGERAKIRSKTFQGIADAMADQWG